MGQQIARWVALVLAPLLFAACDRHPVSSAPASTTVTAAGFCTAMGGRWDAPGGRCTVTRDDDKGTHVDVNAAYPGDLIADPTAGPVLQAFLRQFVDEFGAIDARGSGLANLKYSVYTQVPATKSVVFDADWNYQSMPHPSDGLTTFTFDLTRHQQLQLSDLLCPGVDPLKALPPLARPGVQQRIAGTGLRVEQFEPGGSFADDYQAWVLDADNLVLYLPAARGPGGMPPGFAQPHIPFSTMRPILRDSCSA